MNLWLRLIRIFIAARFGSPLAMPNGVSVIDLRVFPNDLDLNLHMNNGRYLTLMDLGRFDLLVRAGLARAILARRWMPVVTGITIRYRRSLAPFQRFRLETRIIGWTEYSIGLEQRFTITSGRDAGELAAIASIQASVLEPGRPVRKVKTADLFGLLGLTPQSPPWPEGQAAPAPVSDTTTLPPTPQGQPV